MKAYFAFVVLALIACAMANETDKKPQDISNRVAPAPIPAMCTYSLDPGSVCPGVTTPVTYTRYGYNRVARACVTFSYNGCGGNSNNFDNIAECSKTCEV